MLPPANRLKKEKEIKRARTGKMIGESGLLACRAAANDLPVARFCFIVSKKISPKAVVRNKVKRRLRAAIAAAMPRIASGFDCVLIARFGLAAKNYQEICDCVNLVLARTGLIKSNDK
jgi:ribonuclease P protein component